MPLSQDNQQKRVSNRTTKGIPPNRFEDEMPLNHSPAKHSTTKETSAKLSATSVPSPAQAMSTPPPAKAAPSTAPSTSKPPEEASAQDAITRDFDRKMTAMMNEFKRQMHSMQAMVVTNNQQLQESVLQLRSEIAQAPQHYTMTSLSTSPSAMQSVQQSNIPTPIPPPTMPQNKNKPLQQPTTSIAHISSSNQMISQPSELQRSTSQFTPPFSAHPMPQVQPTLQPTAQIDPPFSARPSSQRMPPLIEATMLSTLQAMPQYATQPQPISLPQSAPQPIFSMQPSTQPTLATQPQPISLPQSAPQPTFSMQPTTQPACQAQPQLFCQNNRSTPNSAYEDSVRLNRNKKIYPLPIFSGSPEDWFTFAEAFQSTTMEFEYSPLHNIMRLRDALKGIARETVESLLSNSANVPTIMETLAETFGRPEQLIKSQILKVRTIPHLAEDDLDAMVNFANKMTNMSTFLKNARGEHHLTNPTLLSELVAKLPVQRQLQWAERCLSITGPPSIEDFSQWLNNLRRLINMVTDSLPSTSSQHTRATLQRKPPNLPATSTGRRFACVTVTASKCPLCEGECKCLFVCKTFLNLSVDERWEKMKQLSACFSCLKRGHHATKCFARKRCNTDGCRHVHHPLLHCAVPDRQGASLPCSSNKPPRRTERAPSPSRPSTSNAALQDRRNCHADRSHDGTVLFQVMPVVLYGKKRAITAYAFIDDGANVSMIDQELANELGLHGKPEILELQWINDQSTRQPAEIVNLMISGTEEDAKKYELSNVFTTTSLALPTQSFKIGEFPNEHLAGLPLQEYCNVQPKLIISLTHAFLTVPVEVPRTPCKEGPIAVKTRLGWMVYGPTNKNIVTHSRHIFHLRKNCESDTAMEQLNKMMTEYFDVENFGVKPGVTLKRSEDEEKAIVILEKSIRKSGDRYEAGLLWRDEKVIFPESFQMALHRLESIERKMARDPSYAMEYRMKIEEYLNKGYARRLTEEEAEIRTRKTFYLPHFGVKNPNKSSIRLVFDAAAEIKNMSLNKALLPGPDMNQPLISILFQFRESPIAVCGDIKEMFHQVKIVKEDQDCQRFLWRDGNMDQPVSTYVMKRMIFGATCSPAIAQHIKNINAQSFKAEYPRAVKGIVEKHYVDDYVDCFDTESEAIDVVKRIIKIHKSGGFEMRNIASNSERLKREVGNAVSDTSISIESGEYVERILGMHWSTKTDVFCFGLRFAKIPNEVISFERKPTKRETLSVTMSVFDPFGLLANFTVCAKIIMQAVWKAGIDWDEALPEHIFCKWKSWLNELKKVRDFKVPRCYFVSLKYSDVELHIFCDASEEAMAVVAYWRYVEPAGVRLTFVAAKTSCAPTRYHTIPKLELQAAVIAVRLKDAILKHHGIKVKGCNFWTDSHTVIRWMRSDHRVYKQFVANRVAEILDSSKVSDWRWCPGKLNPADDATRAKFPVRYNAESRWKNGPDFLLLHDSEWPDESQMKTSADKSCDELRKKHFALHICHVSTTIVPNINSFSSFQKYKRAMAWVLRFKSNLLKALRKEMKGSGELITDEINDAEMAILRNVQQKAFKDEIASLSKNQAVSSDSPLVSLNPYLDDLGVMRVNGRIQNAPSLSMSSKRPIILPKEQKVTRLLVESYHKKLRHINTSTVISEIRQRFWIPAIRSLVRSVESSCTFCKVRKATPIQPQMGNLPVDRVTPYVRPFTYTGLDYFGPVQVTIGRRREKRWVALFTCLTVRAVHLEIASDLSSDACLMCVRNFINRRGVPIQIRSDNGTNFVGIEKELDGVDDFLDQNKMVSGLSSLGIKWIFNTASNPSAGGAWERLVQSVKKALNTMLKEHAPRLETFASLLIEAENIVNSRPLTHLPVSPQEPEPITPNHFLLGCTNSTHTPAPFEPRLLCLRKQWRILKNLKNGFWKQWIREYLPELTRRTKWCTPSNPISTGCLVLICDDNAPRSQWRRGRIINLFYGKDNIARSAEVATSSGTLKRPVSKLAILDVEEPRY